LRNLYPQGKAFRQPAQQKTAAEGPPFRTIVE
jgi:hypothetical protein